MLRGRPREYNRGRVIFTTSADGDLLDKFQEVVTREGKPMNRVLQELMSQYVKVHSSGNPSFEITKWVEEPSFKADPAVRESNERWDKYLGQCEEKELAQLLGTFQKRLEQTKACWKKKR